MSTSLYGVALLLPEKCADRVLRWLLSRPRWDIACTQRGGGARGPEVKGHSHKGAMQIFVRRTELQLLVSGDRLGGVGDELRDLLAEQQCRRRVQRLVHAGEFPTRRSSFLKDFE